MTFPFKKVTITGTITSVGVTTSGSPPYPVVDTSLVIDVTYGGTHRLTPGMSIIFFSDIVGITAGVVYYILETDFTTTSFKISETLDGSVKLATGNSSRLTMFAAYMEFVGSDGPAMIFDTNKANQGIIDYTSAYTTLASNSTIMKTLAEGDGIHTIGPYEYLGLINVYKTLVEQGDILKPATIQKSATKVASEKISEYLGIIKNLPKQF